MRLLNASVTATILAGLTHSWSFAQEREVPPDRFFIHNRLSRSVLVELLPDGIHARVPPETVLDFPCHRVREVRVEASTQAFSVECENHYAITGKRDTPFVRLQD